MVDIIYQHAGHTATVLTLHIHACFRSVVALARKTDAPGSGPEKTEEDSGHPSANPKPMADIIQVNDLAKQYPGSDEPAVRGISFSIRRGEIFGFLGPNGAGKTTTISMLACQLEPTSGGATVAGLDLARQSGQVKRRIGLVPQDIALYPTLSARDNLLFFGRVYGLSGSHLRERTEEALRIVGLSDRAGDAVQTFSGGMKRRVNLAAGLLHEPEVLFLDEPTVGVDPQSRNFIFENIERLKSEGLTILYTTHYMEEAQRLCDRVAIIDQGHIIALDTPRGLIDSLGGGVIVLGIPETVPEVLEQSLRGLAGVLEVERTDHQIKVKAEQARKVLVDVMNVVNKTDTPLHSLEILEPNLESVFLSITGRRLRD